MITNWAFDARYPLDHPKKTITPAQSDKFEKLSKSKTSTKKQWIDLAEECGVRFPSNFKKPQLVDHVTKILKSRQEKAQQNKTTENNNNNNAKVQIQ